MSGAKLGELATIANTLRASREPTLLRDMVVPGGIQTGPFGSQLHASDYTPDGVGVVMPQDLGDNTISAATMVRVPEALADSLSKYRLHAGDIVYSRRGDVTRRAIVRSNEGKLLCGTGCLRVRLDTEKADPHFVSYALGLPTVREWIVRHAVGATMANLNTEILGRLPLTLPLLADQRAIAEVLGALDDKISANRRAQAIANQLFHSKWCGFYDELGAPFVPLDSIVSTQYGLTASASDTAVGPKFLRVTDINKLDWIDWSRVPTVPEAECGDEKYLLHKGDLLVARMADPGKSTIYEAEIPSVFASYLVRLKPRSRSEGLFLFGFLKSRQYLSYASSAESGSVQRNMNARVIVGTSVKLPDAKQLARFTEKAAPLRALINALGAENTVLASTRDELLPLLMNGKITVRDAELVAEEVL